MVPGSYADEPAVRALLGAPDRRHPPLRGPVARGRSRPRPGPLVPRQRRGRRSPARGRSAGGRRRLVFSSTAAVYGVPDRTPIQEDDPLRPINTYGETKRTFEGALRWYGEAYGLRSVILRYFNVAGATARAGEVHRPETHLIPNVLGGGRGRRPLTLFGDDYPTPDGTRDPRLHPRRGPRRRAPPRSRLPRPCDHERRAAGLQPRHGDGFSVREVLAAAEAWSAADPAHRRAAAGRRPARARRLERPGTRGPRLGAPPLDPRRDDRLGLGVAARAPRRLRGGLRLSRASRSARSGASRGGGGRRAALRGRGHDLAEPVPAVADRPRATGPMSIVTSRLRTRPGRRRPRASRATGRRSAVEQLADDLRRLAHQPVHPEELADAARAVTSRTMSTRSATWTPPSPEPRIAPATRNSASPAAGPPADPGRCP